MENVTVSLNNIVSSINELELIPSSVTVKRNKGSKSDISVYVRKVPGVQSRVTQILLWIF